MKDFYEQIEEFQAIASAKKLSLETVIDILKTRHRQELEGKVTNEDRERAQTEIKRFLLNGGAFSAADVQDRVQINKPGALRMINAHIAKLSLNYKQAA